jgi:hypothetical protein
MSAADVLWKPKECVMLLVDFQAGLGFAVESIPRQLVRNNRWRTNNAHLDSRSRHHNGVPV